MQKKIVIMRAAALLQLVFFISIALNGKPHKTKTVSHAVATSVEAKADWYDLIFQANYLHAKGDNNGALNAFDSIMKTKSSPHMLNPYLQALFDSEKFDKLVQVYESHKKDIDASLAKNYMTKAFIAQAYLVTKKNAKARHFFDELLSEHGNDVQLCYFIAVGYLKTRHYSAAIKLLQECVNNQALKARHYLFHFLLSKAQLETNHPKEAMVSIEQSIEQFPKFDRGWLFRAILFEQQGKIDEAIKGYKQFLNLAGRDQSIEKQLIQLLFNQQRFGEATNYLKQLSADAPEYCFDLAVIQAKSNNYDEALPTINKVLARDPGAEKARLLKIEILLNSNKVDDALTCLQTWLIEDPNNLGLIHTFFLVRQGGVKAEKLIPTLEAVRVQHPTNLGVVAALGDLSLDAGQPDKALEFYAQAAANTTQKELKGDIYFQRCFILLEQKNTAMLQAELDKAEQDGCTNHALLNLKAYHLANAGHDLDKALSAVDAALKLKPDFPPYLDTKASVLAKMKNPGALSIAQKALSLAPNDSTIQRNVKELSHALQARTSKPANAVHSRG